MATITEARVEPAGVNLHDVEWETYCKLRDEESNNHLRMTYLDGDLTIMSPDPIHEEAADLLALVVRGTAAGSGFAIKGLRTTTLRRGSRPPRGVERTPTTPFTSVPTSTR